MKHVSTVTKPASALVGREWSSFPLFGWGPAFWAGGIQELGDLIGKITPKRDSVL